MNTRATENLTNNNKDNNYFKYLCFKDAEEKMEQNLKEERSQLLKRNEEIEQKVKEVKELRESIKTAEQEKFQELDKVSFLVIFKFPKHLQHCHFAIFKSRRSGIS